MSLAALVSTVFAPELFVLFVALLLIERELRPGGERRHQPRTALLRRFAVRIAVVAVAWLLAFAAYRGGPALISGPVPGGDDAFASLGLIVGFAVIWTVWRRREWGQSIPPYCLLLVGTSVVHALVVPVWDVSSHVLYAVVPTAYLLRVDRRFAVLAVVPLALIWSRVTLGAHTPAEALGGLALGVLIAAVAVRVEWLRERPAGAG